MYQDKGKIREMNNPAVYANGLEKETAGLPVKTDSGYLYQLRRLGMCGGICSVNLLNFMRSRMP
jgi:hypothetical protein